MKPQKQNIKSLLQAISLGLYERDREIALSFLSAVAGESIFLLGLPGVGKSLVGRRLKMAFSNASSFEYLMSRFSTPDEIFGPVSISKLKDENSYERVVEGYLPASDIVFLDEIWKAGSSIQNALLTVLNEKLYRNGKEDLHLPLKGIIAASNELPAKNEGLEALWDRFLLRMIVGEIKSERSFNSMITATSHIHVVVEESLKITNEQYAFWQNSINDIRIEPFVLEAISEIRKAIVMQNAQEGEEMPRIIVSDRRWKKIVRLMRTSAFLNGRNAVELSDMLLISYCIWDYEEQMEPVKNIVEEVLKNHLLNAYNEEYSLIENDLKKVIDQYNNRDLNFEIYDQKYYNIEGLNHGKTLISIDYYQKLSDNTLTEVVMNIRDLSGQSFVLQRLTHGYNSAQKISIIKTRGGIKVNAIEFILERKKEGADLFNLFCEEQKERTEIRICEFHKRLLALVKKIKSNFSSNLFCFEYTNVVQHLNRFELKVRKNLKVLQKDEY